MAARESPLVGVESSVAVRPADNTAWARTGMMLAVSCPGRIHLAGRGGYGTFLDGTDSHLCWLTSLQFRDTCL